MADAETGHISWYSPDPRAILEIDAFSVSRSLRRTIQKKIFEVKFDTQFEEVMRACGDRKETWISEEIVRSYVRLHEMGSAHSVEVWKEGKLAGGLYGVALGGAFFGESMFSSVPDASKVALVFLLAHLKERGYVLLDTQFMTPHLARFGATEIPREAYLTRLQDALRRDCTFL